MAGVYQYVKKTDASYKRRLTPNQAQFVKELKDNPRITQKDAMLKAGYAVSVANQPTIATKSKTVAEAMERAGLTNDYIMDCIAEDIAKKPQKRLGELELACKIKGMLNNTNSGNSQEPQTPPDVKVLIQNAVINFKDSLKNAEISQIDETAE